MSWLRSCTVGLISVLTTSALSSSRSFSRFLRVNDPYRLAMSGYVDAHAHIIHDQFVGEEDSIAEKCKQAGLDHVIINGLEPISNRKILEFCSRQNPHMLPALGIYPLDAACNVIDASNWNHPFAPPDKFDVDAEIDFIELMASEQKIVAIGR